jgi:hypothetical protein
MFKTFKLFKSHYPFPLFEHCEQFEQHPKPVPAQDGAWTDAQEERATIVEHDGGTPRAWAEGFAHLDPNNPPGNVPLERWLYFIDDCGRFLTADGPTKRLP